jgi:hypothetical protein
MKKFLYLLFLITFISCDDETETKLSKEEKQLTENIWTEGEILRDPLSTGVIVISSCQKNDKTYYQPNFEYKLEHGCFSGDLTGNWYWTSRNEELEVYRYVFSNFTNSLVLQDTLNVKIISINDSLLFTRELSSRANSQDDYYDYKYKVLK